MILLRRWFRIFSLSVGIKRKIVRAIGVVTNYGLLALAGGLDGYFDKQAETGLSFINCKAYIVHKSSVLI